MDQLYMIISGLLTGVAGWFVGRRKSAAETDNIVLKNLEQSVGLYKLIIDNLRDEIQGLHLKMDEMETKIDELTLENKKLRDLLNSK
jgi:hypothetical protein